MGDHQRADLNAEPIPEGLQAQGAPVAVFKTRSWVWIFQYVVAILVLGVGVAAVVGAARVPAQQLPLLIVSAAAIGMGLVLSVMAFFFQRQRFFVFANGLGRVFDFKTRFYAWNDFLSIRRVAVPQRVRCFFRMRGKGALDFSSFELIDADGLWQHIESRVLPLVRAEAHRAIRAGEQVDFTWFRLDRQAIHCRSAMGLGFKTVPWEQVQRVAIVQPDGVHHGDLVRILGDNDKLLGVAELGMIPNVTVLLELLAERLGPRAAKPTSPRVPRL